MCVCLLRVAAAAAAAVLMVVWPHPPRLPPSSRKKPSYPEQIRDCYKMHGVRCWARSLSLSYSHTSLESLDYY